MATYEQKKQGTLQLFNAAIAFARQSKQRDYAQILQDAAKRLDDGKFMIVVCGEFRRGKSSLLNALLNEVQDLFPVDIAITTNLVTTVAYGPSENITALIGKADEEYLKEVNIPRSDIRLYVTEKDNPRNEREARLMTIEMPNEQLKQGLVLVDTPGVGGLYARHTDVTYEFLPNADAVLYVSDALQPLSEEDLTFIKERILQYTDQILFVLTKKDRVKNYEQMVKDNREKLAVTLERSADKITIVPVSSYAKCNYLKTQEPEDLEDSNFPELEKVLWQFVSFSRGRVLLARALTILGKIVADMRRPLQVEFDAYQEQNKHKLDEVEASLEEASTYLQRLQENNALWQTQLRDGLEDVRVDVQYRFEQGFANIRHNIYGYVLDDKVIQKPELALEPLQHDLNDLLSVVDRMLHEGATDLQTRIEFATGLALNPFEPDSLAAQSRVLAVQNLPPIQKHSAWDELVVAGQRGGEQGNIAGKVLGLVGKVVVGFIFGHPLIGLLIGEGVGWLLGAQSGAKKAMVQVREQNRQVIADQLLSLLADAQRDYNYKLTKTVRSLENAMRDDLLDKIKRERQSRERALKSLQEARTLTAAEASSRISVLKGPLQQLDHIQQDIEALVQATVSDDDDPPNAYYSTSHHTSLHES